MTKLVIVLAVVVVVILVVVLVAVRNMRAEDPDEFADRPQRRGGNRGGRDDRDLRYDRREPAARQGYDQRGRSSRGYDEDGDVDRRRGRDDRRRAPVPSGTEERRRNGKGPQRRPEPGQARSRRSGDSSEWDSSEWEKLSDVDYWAELASDKPLTTTAQPAGQARSGRPPRADREADPAAVRAPRPASAGSAEAGLAEVGPAGAVPAGAPRRDPVTGLPVRGAPRPADAELATSAIPDAYGRAGYAAAPVSPVAAEDQLRPLAEPRLPLPQHVGPDGPPRPTRGAPPDRPPGHLDDDPLTSPSFPTVPASDSRSYHNGRTSTPARGSRVPERYLPATEQFTSYGSPVSQRPADSPSACPCSRPRAVRPGHVRQPLRQLRDVRQPGHGLELRRLPRPARQRPRVVPALPRGGQHGTTQRDLPAAADGPGQRPRLPGRSGPGARPARRWCAGRRLP
jgi:hypothetical protein